jgi:hypothetical protein
MQHFGKVPEMGAQTIRIILLHSWAQAVPNELFPRLAGGIWWNEVGFSSLILVLSQICLPKSTLSTMLQEEYLDLQQIGQLQLEHSLEDNSANPSIDKLTTFLSQVSL